MLCFPGPWIEDTGHQNPKCDLQEALHAHWIAEQPVATRKSSMMKSEGSWGSRVLDVTLSLEQVFPKASDHAGPHQFTASDAHIASFTQ